MRFPNRSINTGLLVCLAIAGLAVQARSQQLEPRRWSHLPMGMNFAGGGYAYTSGDIAFDPVLLIEDAVMEIHTFPFKYIRTFELLGRSARVDWLQPYQDARWSGVLDGVPTSVARSGWSDMSLRVAVNLFGAPPLSGAEFAQYRAAQDRETIVGLGLVVQVPTGHYLEDKLLNLGSNRFTFRPQLGVVHSWDKWSAELTASSWIYTDNDDFFGGNRLEQDPFYTLQGHVDYTFRPGLWLGAGVAYGLGAKSTVNGIRKDDHKQNLGWILNFGVPIARQWSAKFSYIGIRTLTSVGANSDTLAAALAAQW